MQQGLGQSVRTAPDANPQGTAVSAIGRPDDRLRALRGPPPAGGCDTVFALPGKYPAVEILRGRPTLRMEQQIGSHLTVGANQGMHGLGMHGRLLPGGGGCDERLNFDFVRVEQQADKRHLIVGFVADIAYDDDTRAAHKVVDVRRRERRAYKAIAGREQYSSQDRAGPTK